MDNINGIDIEPSSLVENIHPEEVLYEYDGPRIFVATDKLKQKLLAYQYDESDEGLRFVVSPFSAKLLEELKAGVITLNEAIAQPRIWVIDTDFDFQIKVIKMTTSNVLDPDKLPMPDTMLWPHLQPKLAIRLVHEDAKLGNIPSNIAQNAFDRIKRCFRTLAEHVGESIDSNCEVYKQLLNPTAQKFSFGSFEVAFNIPRPKNSADKEFLGKFRDHLTTGINLLTSSESEDQFDTNVSKIPENDRDAIIAAVKEITPSAHSQLSDIEISGGFISRKNTKFRLTKDEYKYTSKYLKKEASPEMLTLIGKIEECDRGKLTCDLRGITEEDFQTMKCKFDTNLEDDILSAFNEGYRVKVAGTKKESSNVLQVSSLLRVTDPN